MYKVMYELNGFIRESFDRYSHEVELDLSDRCDLFSNDFFKLVTTKDPVITNVDINLFNEDGDFLSMLEFDFYQLEIFRVLMGVEINSNLYEAYRLLWDE